MSSAAPFRFKVHEADAAEIAGANELLKEQGWRARFPDTAEEAIEKIKASEKLSDAQMRAWLLHPDERVVRALMGHSSFTYISTDSEKGKRVRRWALTRALHTNEQESIRWNPLLEFMDRSLQLPAEKRGQEIEMGEQDDFPLKISERERSGRKIVLGLREYVVARVAEEPDAPWVQELLDSGNRDLRSLVAARVRPTHESFLAEAEKSPAFMIALASNSGLKPEHLSRLRMCIMRHLVQRSEPVGRESYEPPIASVVPVFARRGVWSREEALDLLFTVLPAQEAGKHSSGVIPAILALDSNWNAEHIRKLSAYISVQAISHKLSRHRDTPEALLRSIAREHPASGMIDGIINTHPKMAGDEEIVSHMNSFATRWYMGESTKANLVKYGRGAAFRAAVAQMVSRKPAEVIQELLRRSNEEGLIESLYGTDIAPALSSATPAVREGAMRLVGRMQSGKPARAATRRR